jgi:hypothetical protein
MHSLLEPIFAVAPVAPSAQQPSALMLLLYFSTVPTFIMAAIAGRAIAWGVFQFVWLALGIWQFWRWTSGVRNGVRMIGIYVVYACLNLMCILAFLIVEGIMHPGVFLAWPIFGLILALFITVMTIRIVRGFPEQPESE